MFTWSHRYSISIEINITDKSGQSPLFYSVATEEILNVLFINTQDKNGMTPLMYASLEENTNVVCKLISYGCDIAKALGNLNIAS